MKLKINIKQKKEIEKSPFTYKLNYLITIKKYHNR